MSPVEFAGCATKHVKFDGQFVLKWLIGVEYGRKPSSYCLCLDYSNTSPIVWRRCKTPVEDLALVE